MSRLGPFEILAVAGRGAMGVVWRAEHAQTGLPVAVKVLSSERMWTPQLLDAFGNEVRAIAAMSHPNIVQVYDHGVVGPGVRALTGERLPENSPYLAMEWTGAANLEQSLPLQGWPAVRDALQALLGALAHAHARQVLHRDLKPANVMAAGAPPTWKLTDFGIAWLGAENTQAAVAGTPAYMAPEQIAGQWRDMGPWTDLYALGCLAWQLATGNPPFLGGAQDVMVAHLGKDVGPFVPTLDVPEGFESWVRGLLVKDHGRRTRMAAEARLMLGALDGLDDALASQHTINPPQYRPGLAAAHSILPDTGAGLVAMRRVPLVDREAERDTLWKLLDDVAQGGRARVALLTGPTGCGKSRLAEWLCERAHSKGVALWVRATHSRVPVPGDGLEAALSEALGCKGMDEATAVRRIDRLMHDRLENGEGQRLAALFAGTEYMDPADRAALMSKVVAWKASRMPLVLWLDDVQWGIEALTFARTLLDLQLYSPIPVLVVATAGDQALAEAHDAAHTLSELAARPEASSIVVGPLPPRYQRELVRRILGLDADLAARVEERSGGNPLFAVQLVNAWVHQNLLESGPRGYRLRADAPDDLPFDLDEAWASRLDRVLFGESPDAEAALEMAALLGSRVSADEWEEACREAGTWAPWEVVDRLTEARLAASESTRRFTARDWEFAHGMVRECLTRRAEEAGRLADHHATCARVLSRRPLEEVAERLGRHLLAAGELEASLEPLLQGAQKRVHRGDHPGGLALLGERNKAMDELRLPSRDVRRGEGAILEIRLLRQTGSLERARELADATLEAQRSGGWAELEGPLLVERAELAYLAGRLDRAIPLLNQALEVLAQDRGRALRLLARCHAARGELTRARELAEQALGRAEAGSAAEGWCHEQLGALALASGQTRSAKPHLKQALVVAKTRGLTLLRAAVLTDLGELARQRDRLEDAANLFHQAALLARSARDDDAAIAELNLAGVLLETGHYEAARSALARWAHKESAQVRPDRKATILLTQAAVAAGGKHWQDFDLAMGEAFDVLARSQLVQLSFARLCRVAGDLCMKGSKSSRARTAYALSCEQFRQLGRAEDVEYVGALVECCG